MPLSQTDEQPDALGIHRTQIDALNVQLLRLLELRGQVVASVMEWKRERGISAHDPQREEAMLASLCGQIQGPYSAGQIERIFSCIFEVSRALGRAET